MKKFGIFINLTYKRTFGIFINNIMEIFAYQEHKIDIWHKKHTWEN